MSSGVNSSGGPRPRGGAVRALRVGLWLCAAVAAGVTLDSLRHTISAKQETDRGSADIVRSTGLVDSAHKTLASRFTDSKGTLLADPPASPDQLNDPQTLVVAHLVGSDAESPAVAWDQFEAHLAEVTGRKIADEKFDNGADQLARIKDGKITIVALHAADAPFLVNNYGFQPVAMLGDETGVNGNRLDIIVPAASPIARTADLRGHALVCTVPSSITGYRAAIAVLMDNDGLRPNVDYTITWSMGQKRSIAGVAKGEYEAAAVSDEKLRSLIKDGKVSPSQFKTIFQSDTIPRTTIGWFYNLKPELAAKVREAILSYQPGKPSGAVTAAAVIEGDASDGADPSPLRFRPCEYKKDFQFVRRVDDRFDPRLDAGTKGKAATPATAPATRPLGGVAQ